MFDGIQVFFVMQGQWRQESQNIYSVQQWRFRVSITDNMRVQVNPIIIIIFLLPGFARVYNPNPNANSKP